MDEDEEFVTSGGFGGDAEEVFDDGDAAQEDGAALIVRRSFGDQATEDDGAAVFYGDSGDQFLSAEGRDGIARNHLLADDVIVDLGDSEGDFIVGVDERDDFQFEYDITVVDAGAGGGDAADAGAVGENLSGDGDALSGRDDRLAVVGGVDAGARHDFEVGVPFEKIDVFGDGAELAIEIEAVPIEIGESHGQNDVAGLARGGFGVE